MVLVVGFSVLLIGLAAIASAVVGKPWYQKVIVGIIGDKSARLLTGLFGIVLVALSIYIFMPRASSQ